RDEIYEFVDHLNNDLTRKNNFDKDFIMKTCLVLSDLPVQYKVENFNNQNLMLIYSEWERIKSAIERTINLINSFGIDRDTLTIIVLSLINDDNRWRNMSYHQDHIFPQALFTVKHMNNVGLSADRQKRYIVLMNRIANLELLLASENQEKSSQDVEQWLATRT